MDKKIEIVNDIRLDFFTNSSPINWHVNDNSVSYIYRAPNIILDSHKDEAFFFNDVNNHDRDIQIENLIIKLSSECRKLFIDFLDFDENRVILSFKIKSFINQRRDLLTFLKDKFNYNSDFGFHLFMENEKWTYFFGENLFYGSNMEKEKPWENFHLFTVNKDKDDEFRKVIKDEFIVVINDEYLFNNSNFGKSLYNLIPSKVSNLNPN